jgi:phosphatidylserine decarboxylase
LVVVLVGLLAAWVAYFFRDPERAGERGAALVVAPADGRIVHIVEVDEPTFLDARAVRISTFMSVFDVHVNRYPANGVVRHRAHVPGRFRNAAGLLASTENEQASIGIELVALAAPEWPAGPPVRLLVRQIAGLIAQRIITHARVGDMAEQGARFGIIRFGSRVDVYLPVDCARLRVRVGDRVRAGVTVLAVLEHMSAARAAGLDAAEADNAVPHAASGAACDCTMRRSA